MSTINPTYPLSIYLSLKSRILWESSIESIAHQRKTKWLFQKRLCVTFEKLNSTGVKTLQKTNKSKMNMYEVSRNCPIIVGLKIDAV